MENYILKLNSGTEYKLYKGTTLVSDADLTTLFGTAGEMYLSFDFNSGTPSSLTTLTITNSSDVAVISNSNLTDTIAEGKNYKATWSASATTFDTFEELEGKALDESQLSFLMGKIKDAKDIETVEFSSDTTAWSLFGGSDAENKMFLVKNTSGDTRHISFTGSSSETATDKRLSFGNGASMFFLFSKARFDQVRFISYEPSDKTICSGAYGQSVNNPQITRIKVDVENSLTSSESSKALSANQGRILNNRIGTLSNLTTTAKTSAVVAINEVNAKVLTNAGAPTTATVGTVGQLLADTTNGKLYICTDATNPYVWEEVGGGGGIQNALIIREWS